MFSICRPSSLSSRVTRFSWTTGPCWWRRSWFYRLCLVCPSNWASTWPPSFLCVWKATSTTGMPLTSPSLDTSNPSTSTLPRVAGTATFPTNCAQQSVTGVFLPSAHVGLSARMGVDGALGQAAVDWVSELSSSTSLDGSVQLQEGRDLRVTLNTPEDVMDIISVRWVRVF